MPNFSSPRVPATGTLVVVVFVVESDLDIPGWVLAALILTSGVLAAAFAARWYRVDHKRANLIGTLVTLLGLALFLVTYLYISSEPINTPDIGSGAGLILGVLLIVAGAFVTRTPEISETSASRPLQ